MTAKEYFELFAHQDHCEFWDIDWEKNTSTWCGKAPVVAVYITADHLQRGRFLCAKHAVDAEINGDGPVFWLKEAKHD
jgi:hypothetical protein